MIKMRALKAFDYMGRRYKPGDELEPADDAIKALALAQFAVVIDEEEKPKKKQKYKTRHMHAADE